MTDNVQERLRKVHRRRRIIFFSVAGILIVLIMGAFLLKQLPKDEDRPDAIDVSDRVNNGTVPIPLSAVDDGRFHYFSNDIDGVKVRYFIVKDRTAGVRTAFDACDVCYAADKGYLQAGSSARCNNCGNTFTISQLGTENQRGGGCWPGYLPHTIDGSNVLIKLSDLRDGRYYFE